MMTYVCEKCNRSFSQKTHYDDHQSCKRPCKKDNTIEALVEKKVNEALTKTNEVQKIDLKPMTIETDKKDIMDYSKKTREELIAVCKEKGIKGYSGKKRDEIEALIKLPTSPPQIAEESTNKKNKGQFYTTNSAYILDAMPLPPNNIRCIIEPFAGKGDLLEWIEKSGCKIRVEAYDIEPKKGGILQRDTLLNPPDYNDSWIITNPPYLARNKSGNKDIYEMYDTNDLYKCFITSVVNQNNCVGGIFIIPAGFFFSARDIDVRCRNNFMTKYRITKVNYFEETVFDDTTTTIVAFSFEKAIEDLKEQQVEWEVFPSRVKKIFKMEKSVDWIIGGEIYKLSIPESIKIRRHVEGQPLRENEQQTFITLNALDSGKMDGRICLEYKKDYIYPAKECSRTYATFCITGKKLEDSEQQRLCEEFNKFVEEKRKETWSLFLPQFRESKEYARKRIPFELAYRILLHIIHSQKGEI